MENVSYLDKKWIKMMQYGAHLGCHQLPERSFFIHGYQFPICARCTGVLIGQMIGTIMFIGGIKLSIYQILCFIAIMGIDWSIQALKLKMSTNLRRVVTGFTCGIGMTYLFIMCIKWMIVTMKYIFV